jgi:hypothetical protein
MTDQRKQERAAALRDRLAALESEANRKSRIGTATKAHRRSTCAIYSRL